MELWCLHSLGTRGALLKRIHILKMQEGNPPSSVDNWISVLAVLPLLEVSQAHAHIQYAQFEKAKTGLIHTNAKDSLNCPRAGHAVNVVFSFEITFYKTDILVTAAAACVYTKVCSTTHACSCIWYCEAHIFLWHSIAHKTFRNHARAACTLTMPCTRYISIHGCMMDCIFIDMYKINSNIHYILQAHFSIFTTISHNMWLFLSSEKCIRIMSRKTFHKVYKRSSALNSICRRLGVLSGNPDIYFERRKCGQLNSYPSRLFSVFYFLSAMLFTFLEYFLWVCGYRH